jgi:hypothetical protein
MAPNASGAIFAGVKLASLRKTYRQRHLVQDITTITKTSKQTYRSSQGSIDVHLSEAHKVTQMHYTPLEACPLLMKR